MWNVDLILKQSDWMVPVDLSFLTLLMPNQFTYWLCYELIVYE